MDTFLLLLRIALAGVFAAAAFGKLFDRKGSEKSFSDFGVPDYLQRPLASILPIAELGVALTLLFVSTSWFGAVGAAALMIVFLGGMFFQLAKGNAPDCHCFGQLHNEPVGPASVVRNLVLLAMAGFLMGQGRDFQGTSLVNSSQEIMQFTVGLAVIALLASAAFLLKRISDQQNEIVRRIEIMELVGQSESLVERETASSPHEGLPIGAPFPEFELTGVNGDIVSLSDIRAADMPALFIFVSPSCTPCKSLVPEFEQWQLDLKEKVNLVFVSSGTAEANEEKFGANIRRQLVLQKDRELADIVKAKWTPTAILMGRNGRIASHASAGDAAIRRLVDNIRADSFSSELTFFTNSNDVGGHSRLGRKIPQFSLPDISGEVVTSESLMGRNTLVTFWGLGCGHCSNMHTEFRDWDAARSNGDLDVIIFSDGDAASNTELGFRSPVIVDEGYKTSADLGMFGTPSAVLVDDTGTIISETAIGAPDIWALIGKRN